MYPYKFEYYRFQLVPKKVVQLSIDNVAYTYDEIKAKKNEYFSEVLTKTTFKGKKGNLPYRIVYVFRSVEQPKITRNIQA